MTVIDLSAKPLRVRIAWGDGSNSLNVTPLLTAFSTQDDQDYSSGRVRTSGKLTLHCNPLEPFPESTNPRDNPARWARGNQVQIDYIEPDGSFTRHERGRLRILKTPAPPTSDRPQLEIELGCLLTLQDFRQPSDDASEITLGTSTPRHTIISRLAAKAGIPALIDEIPEFPINSPIVTQGSYVETMARLAWDCGCYLWIDNQERLRASKINLRPTSSVQVITVGVNEAAFEPIEPAETPCELIRAVGTRTVVKATTDPEPDTRIDRDSEFDPAAITTTSFSGTATTSPMILTRRREPRGRVFPVEHPGRQSLITASEERKISYYSEEEDGLLLYEYTRIRQPRGVVFPSDFPGSASLVTYQRIYTYYWYLDEVTVRVTTKTLEPAKLVLPPSNPLAKWSGMALAQEDTVLWRKTNRGWRKTEATRNLRAGGKVSSSSGYSGSGNNQPPAPERREEPNYSEEAPLSEEVRFLPVAGATYRERDRDFEMFAPVSRRQAREFALLEGTLLHAQQMAVTWAIAHSSCFGNDYAPIRPIDFVERGVTRRYLTVGVAFSHEGRRCAVAGDGLHLGEVQAANLLPPFRTAFRFDCVIRSRATGVPTQPVAPETPQYLGIFDCVIRSRATGVPTQPNFDFSTIVVDAEGRVVTADGQVVTTDNNPIANEIVVDAEGRVVTADGQVVSVGDSADWGRIVVDVEGRVVTADGQVVWI